MSTRRSFLQHSGALLSGAVIAPAIHNKAFAYFKNKVMPSDQLNIAVIGINGQGWSNLTSALKVPGVNVVGLCDVDQNVLNKRMKDLDAKKVDTSRIIQYPDYRKVLENKEIDAVIIGTPDHWHALQMIHACQAGKDVYVEKPVGNSIGECNAMIRAQERYGNIVQAGQWQRSQQHFTDAIEYVHSGLLGNIRTVKVWCYLDWKQPNAVKPDAPVPAGVDYQKWLGPATMRPFNPNRFHFTFRWFWDYAGGLMTDWGVHLLDYALMGMKATAPKSIATLGGKFAMPNSAEETPDTLMALYEFENFNMIWDHAIGIGNGNYGRDHGIAFIGTNGTLVLNRNGWEVLEEKKNEHKVMVPLKPKVDIGIDRHLENFVSVIKSRKVADLRCSIKEAAHVAKVAQMGNIAYRSGQKLGWNREAGKFTDEAINKKYFMKEYHNGYQLPKI